MDTQDFSAEQRGMSEYICGRWVSRGLWTARKMQK